MQNDKIIGKIIHDRIPIEWMRYNMFSDENIYKYIPMLVFRYQNDCPDELKQELLEAVNTFKGKEKWIIFRHPRTRKDNYILSIKPMKLLIEQFADDMNSGNIESQLGRETYKMYCENAVEDIPRLAVHIEKNLNKN